MSNSWGKLVALCNASGAVVSESVNCAGNKNPLRYRGYYYDKEMGLYYLQSCYYDPETGRFLNADGSLNPSQSLTGMNTYVYCGNNPVMRTDYTGQFWSSLWNTISTIGDWIFPGSKARAEKIMSGSANAYDYLNYFSCGIADTIKGALFPEQPFSVDHWINSAATMLVGGASIIKKAGQAVKSVTRSTKKYVTKSYAMAPKKTTIANSVHIQYENNTKTVKSITHYDYNGNWAIRDDYLGRSHMINGRPTLPHRHIAPPLNDSGQPMGREIVIE